MKTEDKTGKRSCREPNLPSPSPILPPTKPHCAECDTRERRRVAFRFVTLPRKCLCERVKSALVTGISAAFFLCNAPLGAALPPAVAMGRVLLPVRPRNSGQGLPGGAAGHIFLAAGW